MGEFLSQGPLFLACLVFMMGIVVIIHELGHYLAGRLFGAAVESFSVGFGKPMIERRDRFGTRWRVNWIPLGGFVKFVGEHQLPGDGSRVVAGPQGKIYPELSVLQRTLVSLAGPFANFVLSSLIFALIIGVFGRTVQHVGIAQVTPGNPAERAGLQVGDVFISANGSKVQNINDVRIQVMLNPDTPVHFVVDRDGELVPVTVTPEVVKRENELGQIVPQATIGIGFADDSELNQTIHYSPVGAVGAGIAETGRTIGQTVTMLSRIATGRMSIQVMNGPVGIGDISRRVVNRVWSQTDETAGKRLQQLFWMLLNICATISVGVGFFNLLPLPVLDGGHVAFNAYEAVTGRQMPEKVQEISLTVGLFLLLGMVIVITWGDVIETGLFGSGGG